MIVCIIPYLIGTCRDFSLLSILMLVMKWIVICISIAVLILVIFYFIINSAYPSKWREIHVKDTRKYTHKILGRPTVDFFEIKGDHWKDENLFATYWLSLDYALPDTLVDRKIIYVELRICPKDFNWNILTDYHIK